MNSVNEQARKERRRLTLARREIRVTADRPIAFASRPATVAEAVAAFAEALFARHLASQGFWGRLGLVFQRKQAVLVQHVTAPAQVNVAPQLRLTLVRYEAAAPGRTPTAPAQATWLLNRQVQPREGTRIGRRLHRQVRVEPTVQRLLSRSVRVETVAAPGSRPASQKLVPAAVVLPSLADSHPAAPAARPVPRVVRRTGNGADPAENEPSGPISQPGMPNGAPFVAGRWSSAAPEMPAVDIERVTQQVIQQIDRRILAHRERMGRI